MKGLLLSIFLLNAVVLRADDDSKTKVQVTMTDTVDFTPGGALRLDNSIGEVIVTGWDKPQVEVTTVKSKKRLYTPKEREKAIQDLAKIQILTERRGNDVVVTSKYPKYGLIPPYPFRNRHGDLDVEYRISAPRNARLVIDHNSGEVHVADVASDIDVRVRIGSITLRLPEENQYAIDAKADAGGIFSDFPGPIDRRLSLVGHKLNARPSQAMHNLHLRIGFGDIEIVKIRRPYALYDKPAPGIAQ
jgi:hypothetical protein